ncbi:MAG: hypothetical protein CFH01_01449, partial [Alphaproteobacteria bacterium MarineAlpha2_Bin1]
RNYRVMKNIKSYIAGTGSFLPKKKITNSDLELKVDTNDEWIFSRTGIRSRYIASEDETTSTLALGASIKAVENSFINVNEIDLIILATTTPDETFPATATVLQSKLGLTSGIAFDVQAVCSGFVYALTIADSMLKSGQGKKALVVGAEVFSRIIDWNDRSTCVLFGDGAGAVVLDTKEGPENLSNRGILASKLYSDGRMHDSLYVDGGPGSTQTTGFVKMDGKEVFKHAVINMSNVVLELISDLKISIDEIDWLIPHQANKRILDSTAKKLGVPEEKVVITVDKHANTSAASIPLALDVAVNDGRIKRGDLVLIEAMGGGFTWGASLIRW